jgi:phosphopantothenoylcysteine decarboxylase/phosphopantothenate--cysteine ligase
LTAKRDRKRILVTAGPTRENIDPVRFMSNHSTGVFGYAIASEAKKRGHVVTLVSGPTALERPKGVKFVAVESALDMMRSVMREAKNADCVIMAAAVADWRPRKAAKNKIKKGSASVKLELVKNPDILAELGKKKGNKVLVGFALETEDLIKNALKKLKAKNLDIVIANKLSKKSAVFGNNPAKIAILDRFGAKEEVRAGSKARMAQIILDKALAFNI